MYKVEDLDHYARGICKIDGKIAFIENALKDELIEVKLINEKKNYIEGSVSKYIEKSKDRVHVKCPYYDKCGGCNIMHLGYNNQLKFKQEKIENIVNKYLNKDIKINNIVKSDNDLFYRNKVTFQVKEKVGFYNSKTYDIVCVDECLISNKIINNSIKYLNKLELKYIDKITCRVGSNELMIIIETNNKDLNIDVLKGIAKSIYLKVNNKYIHVYGNEYIYENLGEFKYAISPDSFFQININTCYKLYRKIKDYVGSNKNVLDLYCGTGSIGIFVNSNNRVIGIEINESAINDALNNKEINRIENIDFICGDSGKKLEKLKFNPDVIIVDPPRSGLNKEALDNILKFSPKEIIYVSCDPMTMVRDLKILSKNYIINEITPFDMFPNTHHVECLTCLKKV